MPRGGKRNGAGRKPGSRRAAAQPPAPGPLSSAPAATPTIDNPFKLNPRELLFVELYTGVCKLNASEAFKQAGYKANRHNAARLMMKPNVQAAVSARLSARLQTLQMSGDEALEGVTRIARADIRQMFDAAGNVVPLVNLGDDIADCIAGVKVVERRVEAGKDADGNPKFEFEYTKEFKLYDKLKARELMARVNGKLVEQHNHNHRLPTVPPGTAFQFVIQQIPGSENRT